MPIPIRTRDRTPAERREHLLRGGLLMASAILGIVVGKLTGNVLLGGGTAIVLAVIALFVVMPRLERH